MRYLVLTDIHANLEALDTCLADALVRTYDATLVLGDLVGYGPDPNAVVERVQALQPIAIVRGNHDKVACGLEQADGFNSVAKTAAARRRARRVRDRRHETAPRRLVPLEVSRRRDPGEDHRRRPARGARAAAGVGTLKVELKVEGSSHFSLLTFVAALSSRRLSSAA